MKFTFISTPKSIKKLMLFYKGLDEIGNVTHSEKLADHYNFNLKNMPAAAKNMQIDMIVYLNDISKYSFDEDSDFIASMYQHMLQCYVAFATCPAVEVTETYDDYKALYESKVTIRNVIHSGTSREKYIEKCIDSAMSKSGASVLGDSIDIDHTNDSVIILIHMNADIFRKDASTASQIGKFIKELIIVLNNKVSRDSVICCNKCFKKLMDISYPYLPFHKDRSQFEIVDKCTCCEGASWIDIDQEMYDLIKYVNENGLKTIFCCGSHPGHLFYDIYIMFDTESISDENLVKYVNMAVQDESFGDLLAFNKYFEIHPQNKYSAGNAIKSKYTPYEELAADVGFIAARDMLINLLSRVLHGVCDIMKEEKEVSHE